MATLPFRDREEAARQLAAALSGYRGTRPVVLAIPRGAVPMGRIVADALGGELDVMLVRKIGAPGMPEFAIGAVDETGAFLLNEGASWVGGDNAYVQQQVRRELAVIRERRARYCGGRAGIPLAGRTVIVIDDGLATGATMMAALKAARAQAPSRLVCAVPVAARDSVAQVARYADDVVCLATPWPFRAVGEHYIHFEPVDDAQVVAALGAGAPGSAIHSEAATATYSVDIPCGRVHLQGDLSSPADPQGLVIFAHGSGSSRLSPRNRQVAHALNLRGLATLLLDLLTPAEDRDAGNRFDIGLLTERLEAALDWVLDERAQHRMPIGLFGSSTGAAAALGLAAVRPDEVSAVVSRGGRPDLAGAAALSRVQAPTLLIVGGADPQVLSLNRTALAAIDGSAELVVVPGATHLFEEPGALDRVTVLAGDWFSRYLVPGPESLGGPHGAHGAHGTQHSTGAR